VSLLSVVNAVPAIFSRGSHRRLMRQGAVPGPPRSWRSCRYSTASRRVP